MVDHHRYELKSITAKRIVACCAMLLVVSASIVAQLVVTALTTVKKRFVLAGAFDRRARRSAGVIGVDFYSFGKALAVGSNSRPPKRFRRTAGPTGLCYLAQDTLMKPKNI